MIIPLDYRSSRDEPINHDNHGNDEKEVNQPATNVHYEEAKNPQDQQNHRNRPKH